MKKVEFIFFIIKNLHSLNDTIMKVSKGKYFQHILSRKDLYPEFIKNSYKLIRKRPGRKINEFHGRTKPKWPINVGGEIQLNS